MNRWPIFVAAVQTVSIISVGCTSLPDRAGTLQGVEAFHSRVINSFNSCDADAFASAYAGSFKFTTSHTKTAISESNGLRGYLGFGCKQSPSPQVRVGSQSIQLFNEQAVVTGQYIFSRLINGKIGDETQNYTLVLARNNGDWRITAHHVSIAP